LPRARLGLKWLLWKPLPGGARRDQAGEISGALRAARSRGKSLSIGISGAIDGALAECTRRRLVSAEAGVN
jgi:hypothetical protein